MITFEWAKQLAHDVINPNLDFENMKFIQIAPGTSLLRFPIMPPLEFSLYDSDPIYLYPDIKYEDVEIKKCVDYINGEVTRIGYHPRTNCLLFGETRQIEALKVSE